MLLTQDKADQFQYLYQNLLSYANDRLKLVTKQTDQYITQEKIASILGRIRDGLFENPQVIDDFVRKNPSELDQDALKIVANRKYFVEGTFHVVKQLKDYAIFLSDEKPPRAYGVVGLHDTIEDMTGWPLPVMLKTVLLPFDGVIVHDGLLSLYPISFGAGMRKSIKVEYEEAESRFGIITSLPFEGGEKQRSDIDLLKFYMKNEESRDRYWSEIEDLIAKSSDLYDVYQQEMGRVHARTYRKRLKDATVRPAWFAILGGIIIASGSTEAEARDSALRFVPDERRNHIHVFQYKG